MISFSARPWHPSAFLLLKSNFLGTYWSDLSNFGIITTTGSRSIMFQVFGHQKFFRPSFISKVQFSDFLEGKGYIFESSLYSELGNAKNFPLIDGGPFNWAAWCAIICFRQKSGNFFQSFDIPHCVSYLWRSFSTNALLGSVCLLLSCIDRVAIDRGQNFRWPKVLRRAVFGENNRKQMFFFRGQVLVCSTSLY